MNLRDLLKQADEGLTGAMDAADELMTEFISKKRAAKWDVINNGLIAASKARKAIREVTGKK